mgnify:CR=1 FL=1
MDNDPFCSSVFLARIIFRFVFTALIGSCFSDTYGCSGRYAEQRLLLTIKTNDGTVHQLNDSLSAESFVAALDSDGETNIPLIQLYRFLAERLPDKAKGYVKQEKNEADI